MTRTRIATLVSLAALFAAATLHAQTGCGDSPENPTAVLGLVGASGWLLASFRHRIANLARRTLRHRKRSD